MSNELCSANADVLEANASALAIKAGQNKIQQLLSDLGPKVEIKNRRMIIVDQVDPDEALAIMFRLRSEMEADGTALKYIRLWQGDFCAAFARQMEIPMSKAAGELAEVFGEKPKRILRLVNTAERSPEEFRQADVDYTTLQTLADLPIDKDPEVAAKTEEAKKAIIEAANSGEVTPKWIREKISSIKSVVEAEETKPAVTLESILVQHYNLAKFFAECPDADTCQRIEDSMKALEPSIENLANARGHKLYFEMDEAPLVDGLAEETNIDEII